MVSYPGLSFHEASHSNFTPLNRYHILRNYLVHLRLHLKVLFQAINEPQSLLLQCAGTFKKDLIHFVSSELFV